MNTLPKPFYQDDACQCGCGRTVANGRRFVSGHNLKILIRTESHRMGISEGQKLAWQTKRKRKPLGSKNLDCRGYVRVKVVRGTGRWEKEHKLVAEAMIGRKLTDQECVHHINGIKTDNRPENLFVCNKRDHSRIEQSCGRLIKEMLSKGLVVFNKNTGEYEPRF